MNTIEADLHEAGFANIAQAQQGIAYLGTSLEDRLRHCQPPNHKYIRGFFDYATPDKPGLTIRDNQTMPFCNTQEPRPFKEMLWCSDAGEIEGRVTVFPMRGEQEAWSLNTIAVEQHLQFEHRRKIANVFYDALFEHDWIRYPETSKTLPATKALWRQYRERLQKLPDHVLETVFDCESFIDEHRVLVRDILRS